MPPLREFLGNIPPDDVTRRPNPKGPSVFEIDVAKCFIKS